MHRKSLIIAILFLIILGIGFLSWVQYFRYYPRQVSSLFAQNKIEKSIEIGDSLGILMWNISYGGMPSEMDFFYSGGDKIQLNERKSKENFQNILDKITEYRDSTDVFLFQKIDTVSTRSYHKNQYFEIQNKLPEYESSFCLNFSVPYIPVPLNDPIGAVHSGLLSMSKFGMNEYQRISLNDKEYFWPKKLFTAQKCIQLLSTDVGNKKLHVLHVHLNSYDFQGEIRLAQLAQVERIADSLFQRGDYVVIAGGWNMSPPGFQKYKIRYGYKAKPAFPEIDSSVYFENWKFEYNPIFPTSRSLAEEYRHGAINTSIKDFFICSPNVTILKVNTDHNEFKWSDHHAVYLRILLLPEWDK